MSAATFDYSSLDDEEEPAKHMRPARACCTGTLGEQQRARTSLRQEIMLMKWKQNIAKRTWRNDAGEPTDEFGNPHDTSLDSDASCDSKPVCIKKTSQSVEVPGAESRSVAITPLPAARPQPRNKTKNECWRAGSEWAPPKEQELVYRTTKKELQYWTEERKRRGMPYGWAQYMASKADSMMSYEEHLQGKSRWLLNVDKHGLSWEEFKGKFCTGGYAGRRNGDGSNSPASSSSSSTSSESTSDSDSEGDQKQAAVTRVVTPGYDGMSKEEKKAATQQMRRKYARSTFVASMQRDTHRTVGRGATKESGEVGQVEGLAEGGKESPL
ncbi:unnamed protein product [Amoebophrya sp. A25]|nr:unnamed protein product [Amoebophrya sp. A25]|eukprot:GSA25T00007136001.1